MATFSNSQPDLKVHENYLSTSVDIHATTGVKDGPRPYSYIDTSQQNVTSNNLTMHMLSNQQPAPATSSLQNRIYNQSTSSIADSKSPSNRKQSVQHTMPESINDYQNDTIRANFYKSNSSMNRINHSYLSSTRNDNSRSPPRNTSTAVEHMVTAGEVDMSEEYGGPSTTEPVSRARLAIIEATRRDGELSSDGRRTVKNIINQTSFSNQVLAQQPQHVSFPATDNNSAEINRSYANISELSHTVSPSLIKTNRLWCF